MADQTATAPLRLLPGGASISAPISDDKVEEREGFGPDPRAAGVAELVESAQRGDRGAFGELYRMHHPQLFRAARLHLGEGAEDAVADTFLRAWNGLTRYRNSGAPFAAWLYGILRHVVADELARRRRVEPREALPDRGVELSEDDRLVLADAIARLPAAQRQVIELKYLVGLRNPEVAAALGTTEGAVNAKQWRALRSLQEMLDGS